MRTGKPEENLEHFFPASHGSYNTRGRCYYFSTPKYINSRSGGPRRRSPGGTGRRRRYHDCPVERFVRSANHCDKGVPGARARTHCI